MKVKRGGIICGHDWLPDANHRHHGAFKAVNEFLGNKWEIINLEGYTQWVIRETL
jgi:hypothetical protein